MVILNSKLFFDAHINHKVSKANKILKITRKILKFLDKVTLEHLHKAFATHHFESSNFSFNFAIKHNEKIQYVQRRATTLNYLNSHLSYP